MSPGTMVGTMSLVHPPKAAQEPEPEPGNKGSRALRGADAIIAGPTVWSLQDGLLAHGPK